MRELIKYQTEKLPETVRRVTINGVLGFIGIASPINCCVDCNWEIEPAFAWNCVISGVQAASLNSALKKSMVEKGLESVRLIESEDEINNVPPASSSLQKERFLRKQITKLR